MFASAQQKIDALVKTSNRLAEFGPIMDEQQGVYKTSWCGNPICEAQVKEYKGTVRCILPADLLFNNCFVCSQQANHNIVVAKAY